MVNVFEAVDVITLIKDSNYDNLALNVGDALQLRADVRVLLFLCSASSSTFPVLLFSSTILNSLTFLPSPLLITRLFLLHLSYSFNMFLFSTLPHYLPVLPVSSATLLTLP